MYEYTGKIHGRRVKGIEAVIYAEAKRPEGQQMTREEIENLISHEANSLLRVWASFMKRGSWGKGYPKSAAGMSSVSIGCWDDLEEVWENGTASAVNAVMNDLPSNNYIAISNFYCSKGWRFSNEETEFLFNAVDAFIQKAKGRGLM